MFFKYVFGTKFINPIVGSSIIIELHQNDSCINNTYYIQYYVNDELLLELEYKAFKMKILKYLWTENEINKFCKFIVSSEYKSKINKYHICLILTLLILFVSIYINSKLFFKLKNLKINKNKEHELKEILN